MHFYDCVCCDEPTTHHATKSKPTHLVVPKMSAPFSSAMAACGCGCDRCCRCGGGSVLLLLLLLLLVAGGAPPAGVVRGEAAARLAAASSISTISREPPTAAC